MDLQDSCNKVGLPFKLVYPYKSFIASFSIKSPIKLKSPMKTKRPYFEDCNARFLLSNLRCSPTKDLDGLYEQCISHFCQIFDRRFFRTY